MSFFGCQQRPGELRLGLPAQELFHDNATLRPHSLPYQRAALILAGTTIPVDVSVLTSGDLIRFRLKAHDAILEEETYRVLPQGLQLVSAAGERYDPPIFIVRYPFRDGDRWSWNGTIESGDRHRQATAVVSVEGEKINLAGGQFDAIRVDVQLTYVGEPARRTLSFWFNPGHGIVKREFGAGSTREPLPNEVDR